MRLVALHEPSEETLDDVEHFEIERTSGVFFRVRRRPQPGDPPDAEDVARQVQALTRTWAAVLFAPAFRTGPRASVEPAPALASDAGFSLVMRLGAWLPQAGDTACELEVPAYVRKWMPVDRAIVVPIQALSTVGWIAVPNAAKTRDLVRKIEQIASAVALDLDRADRRTRLAALNQPF